MNAAIVHMNNELSETASPVTSEINILTLICAFPHRKCVCVLVCVCSGELNSCKNRLEPINTQSSVNSTSVTNV